jgi:two-component system chemotaxis response regulator CheB
VPFELVVVGTSWGGLEALGRLLDLLPDELDVPIAIAQHRGSEREGGLEHLLQRHVARPVREAGDKDAIERRHIYLAPADYHLLVDEPGRFALSTEERVNFSRPSIDVLFESAADAYAERLIGVILTGANADGARGLAAIKERGGAAIVQDPATAQKRAMPDAAIAAASAIVLPLDEIPAALSNLCLAGSVS